jgi:hypothetical protein
MMRTRPIRMQVLLFRLALLLVLLCMQHGALQHAYSHFGLIPDPYATGGENAPPAQSCDLGVVHAALDGNPPNSVALGTATVASPAPSLFPVTAVSPLSPRFFQSRAPPTRA